jgi:hypothetical protein
MIFIRYAQIQKIGKQNNLKVFGSKKVKWPKQNVKNRLSSLIFRPKMLYLKIQKSIYITGMVFFQLFNWFQLFSSEFFFLESCWTWSEQAKNDHLERGCRWFQLFYFLTRIIPDIRVITWLILQVRFSFFSRCNKVLPGAEAAYQEGLPTHYVTNFHLNKVSTVRKITLFGK